MDDGGTSHATDSSVSTTVAGSRPNRPAAVPRWVWIVVLVMALRLFTVLIAFLANVAFPPFEPSRQTFFARPHLVWDTFVRYDSGWYHGIAKNAYRYIPNEPNNLAFFPVYPLAMRYIGRALGGAHEDFYLAGVLVSWIAFACAAVLLHRVALLDVSEAAADRAVCYLAVFPFAFFFGLVYSESVFLALLLTSVYAFRTRRWAIGGLSAAVLSATRVNGVLMLPGLLVLGWQRAGSSAADKARVVAAAAFGATGLIVYSWYVHSVSGSYREWFDSIQRWDYTPGGPPWLPLVRLVHLLWDRPYAYIANEPYNVLNGVVAVVFLAAIPSIYRRLGLAYVLLMVPTLWLPMSSGLMIGLGRYCAVLFPFFIWLARSESKLAQACLLVVSAMLYAFCAALFATLRPLY